MQDLERAIRERAYDIWIESGCRDGNAEENWLAAQREVLSAFLGAIARVSIAEPNAPKKAAKQRKTKGRKPQVAA